jgi:acyl-CoA reductase-like NAD-dependent aldehyde dehydrogenase
MAITGNRPATCITRPDVRPGQLFIAGHWREASDGARTDVIDPSTGRTITTVAAGTTADVDAAVTAAGAAFRAWRDTPPRERARILHRVSELVRERADAIVAVESDHRLRAARTCPACRPSCR